MFYVKITFILSVSVRERQALLQDTTDSTPPVPAAAGTPDAQQSRPTKPHFDAQSRQLDLRTSFSKGQSQCCSATHLPQMASTSASSCAPPPSQLAQGAKGTAETHSQPREARDECSEEYPDQVSGIDAEVLMRPEKTSPLEVLLGACTLRGSDKESVATAVDMLSTPGFSDDVETVTPSEADAQVETDADAALPPLTPVAAFPGYFERQGLAPLCGMHALNNALGLPFLTQDVMTVACTEYLSEAAAEGNPEDRTLHESPHAGWYSEAVMAFALRWQENLFSFDLDSPILPDDETLLRIFEADPAGIVVNENGQHWSCFKVYDENIWFLDSLREPVHVSFDSYVAFLRRYRRAYAVRKLG